MKTWKSFAVISDPFTISVLHLEVQCPACHSLIRVPSWLPRLLCINSTFVCFIFFRYLSQLYKIPTVLLSEISCIENDSETPTEEGDAIAHSQSIVSPFPRFYLDDIPWIPPEPANPKKPRFFPVQKSVGFHSEQRIPSLLHRLSKVSPRFPSPLVRSTPRGTSIAKTSYLTA